MAPDSKHGPDNSWPPVLTEESKRRRTTKNRILSEKARERSRMLRDASRKVIDESRELVALSRAKTERRHPKDAIADDQTADRP